MPKYVKATYCKNCGGSNEWAFEKGRSLMAKPKLCSLCGYDLLTGKKPKKKKIKAETQKPVERKAPISKSIPPLELEEESCHFGNKIVSTLGDFISPVSKETPENSENANQEENQKT